MSKYALKVVANALYHSWGGDVLDGDAVDGDVDDEY